MILFDSVDQVREHVVTALGDGALVRAVEDAEAAIDRVGGPVGEIREERPGRGSAIIILARRAASIRAIREHGDDEDLAGDDWRLLSDQRSIRRLHDGTNAAHAWRRPIVSYQPVDELATRRMVAIELVKGSLTSMPGVLGFTEGNWTIQYANGQTWRSSRQDALDELGPEWGFA